MAQINKPNEYFNTVLWSGDNATNKAITGVNFQPDLVWIKARTEVHQHNLFDVIRGVNKNLSSNLTSAEATDNLYGYLASYDTDGFTTQKGSSSGQWNVNETGENYVAWNWLADNTSGSSNTDGSITSTVSANTTSGFSIVSYTGNGTDGATVGHGLGVVPNIVLIKKRSTAGNHWIMYHSALPSANYFLYLCDTDPQQTATGFFNNTAPTSSVFTIGSDAQVNANTSTLIAYCFAEKKGFSKFGSYTGNGSANDGTFIYTGFKPSWVMMKRTNTTGEWGMFDNKRNSFNVATAELKANASDAEEVNGAIDFLSNGFKLKATSAFMNASGSTYIFMAFAENPLVGTNNIPTTAR